MVKPKQEPPCDRQAAILEHLCRYRITTVSAVHRLFFPGEREATARYSIRRLEGRTDEAAGLITSRYLFANRKYYQLNADGARELGQAEEVAKPLGPQALPRAYGVLNFCCLLGEQERRRVTRHEFQSHFGNLLADGLPFNDYCLVQVEEHMRLSRIIVDLGGGPDRLVRKLIGIYRELERMPAMLQFVDADAFQFAVVTTSHHKAEAILRAADELSPNLPVATEVCADLVQLLPNFYESLGKS